MSRFFKVFLIANRFMLPLRYSLLKLSDPGHGDNAHFHKPFRNLPIRILMTLVAIAVLILPCIACGGGGIVDRPSPATALTVGAVLQQLTVDVDNIVKNAAANAQSDILAAAGGVQDAIDEAASAYA